MSDPLTTRRRRQAKATGGPTLHDVARAVGISSASVSRALSRPELVSEALQGRVKAAVRDLGYVPNLAARSLSGRPSGLVGAVVSTLDDPAAVQALHALTQELATGGIALIVSLAGKSETESQECVRRLIALGVDAVVFCAGAIPVEPGTFGSHRGVRFACLDEEVAEPAWTWSGFDRARMLALGARYLQQLGHDRIAVFAAGEDRRIDAVRGILAGTHIEIVSSLPTEHLDEACGAGDALAYWWGLPRPPTAVVCGSDVAAVALLRECRRREIAVPTRWSVIGFGDTEIARHAQPALTSLRAPAREAGRALGRILLASDPGRSEKALELFAKLVVRESTAPRSP